MQCAFQFDRLAYTLTSHGPCRYSLEQHHSSDRLCRPIVLPTGVTFHSVPCVKLAETLQLSSPVRRHESTLGQRKRRIKRGRRATDVTLQYLSNDQG